ncbi:MAG: BatA and WFA domain-containing protein [Bacteroidales bacterium]|nr:BatA and WFA domain-containing protein [Bacteroidales bacterium]
MTFLYPNFLWALFLIIIPIIIHLFNFRFHKTIYFSNIRFLENLKNESHSKSRLKQILILISRILFLISLVTAFSFPYIDKNKEYKNIEEKIVSIYIDNSFSMNAESVNGNIFDAAKERAKLIVNSFDNNQKFTFINNQLEAKHRNITNKEQILKFINNTDLSAKRKSISEIIDFQTQFLNDEFKNTKFLNNSFLISDFQKNISDFQKIKSDSNLILNIIPLAGNKLNNIYIDSVWFESPERRFNKVETLNVKITNTGTETYENIPIKLLINNKQKAVSNFNIDEKSTINIQINFTNTEKGNLNAKLEITDYPISFDNSFYFNYHIINKIQILLLANNNENKFIKALFENKIDFLLDYSNITNLKTSDISKYQLIILDEIENFSSGFIQLIKEYINNGGNLLFIPNQNGDLINYNELLSSLNAEKFQYLDTNKTQIGLIEYQHFIYNGVFNKQTEKPILPEIKRHFKKTNSALNFEKVILKSVNDDILLSQLNFEKSNVYIFSFPINQTNSNFVIHPLFVPTIYNIAAYSLENNKLYYVIGKEKNINLSTKKLDGDQILHIKNSENNFDFIPNTVNSKNNIKITMLDEITKEGNYFLTNNGDTISGLSFNYDRKESEVYFYTNDEILNLIKQNKLINTQILSSKQDNLNSELNELKNERTDLWKIFIILSLLFLVIEILLIKLIKNN